MRLSRFSLASLSIVALLTVSFSVPLALAVDAPTISDYVSPIDATKTTISGYTEPGYKVTITGGTYQISPIYADDDGYWEVTVALVQESTNTYSIKATDDEGNVSDNVTVEIIEGEEEAAAAEASGGGDHTAPDAVEFDDYEEEIEGDEYTFTGTGEGDAMITVSGSDSTTKQINSDGTWNITVDVTLYEENSYTFTVEDDAGNVSPAAYATITEISEAPDVEVTEDEETGEVEITTDVDVILITDIYGHWAQDYIVTLISEGVVSGYEDGTYRPDDVINRAEFTKIVMGALGYDIPDTMTTDYFTDVVSSQWYAAYAEVAYEEGIIEGYDDGTFGADLEINRAEAMKILLAAADIETETPTESPFTDVSVDDWFAPYVITAYEMEIVSGYDDGSFGAADSMTRGQVAKVIVELQAQL
jgi:hypothetical protein